MPRDGSGNFSLVAGNPVVSGTTITAAVQNNTLSDIATAITGSLSRDGQAAATGTLNMGTNAISGVTTLAASGAVTAASLIPTSAIVPANGMYLSAANTLAWATNSGVRMTLDASGVLTVNAVASTNWALLNVANVFLAAQQISAVAAKLVLFDTTGAADQKRTEIQGADTAGKSFRIFSSTDAGVAGSDLLLAQRSGTTWTSLALVATSITLNGVAVSDYPRLSQSNVFSQTVAGAVSQILTNLSANAAAYSSFRLYNDQNSAARALEIDYTSSAYGTLVTGGPSGEQGAIGTTGAKPLTLYTNNTAALTIDSSRNFDFKAGTVTTTNSSPNEVGFKGLPRTTSAPNPGECRAISAGVTINTGLLTGQFYSYYNDSAAQVTLTKGTVTNLRLAGTTSDGNRTIEARGMATIWANSATEFIVSGPGVG